MKVSLNWLKNYTRVEMDITSLSDALTMAGLEVDSVFERYSFLYSVVVTRIQEIKPHPNADRLKICIVLHEGRLINIVCGAPNVRTGMTVPLALPGSTFDSGLIIKKNIIRGIKSEGMLCSEAELGLGTNDKGIMELDETLPIGENLAKALGLSDTIIEIDLTPNRPDCLSMIGVAREIAALQNNSLTYPDSFVSDYRRSSDSSAKISDLTSVTVEADDHCPRYAATIFDKVNVTSSPFWLQDRLMSIGLKPVNNIVDITNFVMMETGQPLHAFDLDRLSQNRIIVRTANEGENFVTLDKKERKLSSEMLMICDGEKPVAIAGVMGGLNSEIKQSTTRILLESAYFDPASIRKTSKKLGLNTEASHRFERGVDPGITLSAINRASQLLVETGCCKQTYEIIDKYKVIDPVEVMLSVKETNRLLGTDLGKNEIIKLLKSIEMKIEAKGTGTFDKILVTPPSYRPDIKKSVDLMEEVARMSGYNKIPVTFPLISSKTKIPSKETDNKNRIRNLMAGFGYFETINYSFIKEHSDNDLRLGPDDPRRNCVKIVNPLSVDHAVMRTSLIPGLLETMHRNISKRIKNLKVFEIGKIFINRGMDKLPEETEMLASLQTGARSDVTWNIKEIDCDFFDIKGVVEGLFKALHIKNSEGKFPLFTMIPDDLCTYTMPGYSARIIAENEIIGLVGEVNRDVLKNFDLSQPTFIFELDLLKLYRLIPDAVKSIPLPKFPAVSRDITMIIDKDLETAAIINGVKELNQKLVENINLLDVFEGKLITDNKKSISFRITYRSSTETLKDDKINKLHKNLTEKLLNKFDAKLPA